MQSAKVAQDAASAADRKRGPLSATLPQPNTAITKRTLRECIPRECFVRSYTHSFAALGWDLFMVVVAYLCVSWAAGALPAVLVPFAWLGYWWYQGLTCTGLWVIAHECGHGGFTDSRLVNDTVGFLIHSALLTPYFSWALTHAKHHHYTNHMTMGETWVPSMAPPDKKAVQKAKTAGGTLKRIIVVAVMGWYVYLFTNETGAKENKGQSHFNPSSKALFKPKDRPYVIASNVGMTVGLVVLAGCVQSYGLLAVIKVYVVPQMITNFYLAAITFMQHTHEDVPHFNSDEWTWLRGAVSTIDRSMGSFANAKTHHIVDSHVVHHVFSDMPYYGALQATPYVAEHLGIYYKNVPDEPLLGSQYLRYWADFFQCMRKGVTVGPTTEADGFHWFK